ncbi:uncharacterized protein LOC114528470 isoform X2 [Dendronephthya gigantea]|nr:uncharacterized protein LOC114528470 isoform X2 [Dendronephthya gigantea]
MNRSKAAKLLIAEGAPAGVHDNLGNSALSLLIEKIPEVALDAMDQFHSVDTINRKEFYFLNYLEGTKLKEEKTPARTPLEIAVQNERFDIIMHPVMQRLIGVKWQCYGKWGAVQDLALNLIYTTLWTLLAITLPKYGRDLYIPIGPNSWRLVVGIFLILLTIVEIRKQILNTIKTRQEHNAWKEWRASELERDIEYCHPRWPQEAQYVNAEIKAVRNLSLMSGSVYWIYFDWVALVLIFATIASHLIFFHYSTDLSKEVHHYIIMPLLLILWLRIFKYARPFESAGPFIVIFSSVFGDITKWAFLNLVIIIPFTCAFWLTFGAVSIQPVEGYDHVGPLLYNIFSMMVVNSHGFENLEKANPFMARLLCGGFIAIAAIVTLNLLIALLTNTFERLYENAVANAVMQRAETILLLQKSLRRKQKSKYYKFIKERASPEVISRNLGRLMTMDHDEASIERVRDDVREIMQILGEQFGKRFRKGKKSDLDIVRTDINKLRRIQEEVVVDVRNMKLLFENVQEQLSSICKMTPPIIMTTTNCKNQNEDNGDNSDEKNSSSEDDGYKRKNIHSNSHEKILVNNARETSSDRSKNIKKINDKMKNKNMDDNSRNALSRRFKERDFKSMKKSHNGSGQETPQKSQELSTESGSSNTESNSQSEENFENNVKLMSYKRRDERSKNKSVNPRNEFNLRLEKNSQRESNFEEMPTQNDDGATKLKLKKPPGKVKSHFYDVRDPAVPQQSLMYSPGYVPLHDASSDNQNLAFQRIPYQQGQSQIFPPGVWKYNDIPFNPIPQESFSNTHVGSPLVHQTNPSGTVSMQQELPPQFQVVHGKPYMLNPSIWSDPKYVPSNGGVVQSTGRRHQLGYFHERELEKGKITEGVATDQPMPTSALRRTTPQISSNKPQICRSSTQTTTTLQEPRTYVSENYGFERDGELFKPIIRTGYPPDDQISPRFETEQSIHSLQEYRHENYDKDRTFSPSSSFDQIRSNPRRLPASASVNSTFPNEGSTKPLFSQFLKSSSDSTLHRDQNFVHAASDSRERQRSISLQPTRNELKIISRRRQSENVNVKRPSFQIEEKEFLEPFQSLRQAVKPNDSSDAFSQDEASLSPSTKKNVEEEKTEEGFMSRTTPETRDCDDIGKSQVN